MSKSNDPDLDTSSLRRWLIKYDEQKIAALPREVPDVITISDSDEEEKQDERAVSRSVERSESPQGSEPVQEEKEGSETPSDNSGEADAGKQICGRKYINAASVAMEKLMLEEPTGKKKWIKVDVREAPKDPDDEEIDKLIRDHADEPKTYWEELTARMEKENEDFAFDYIIATPPNTNPEAVSKSKNTHLLLKWTHFAVPTWNYANDVNAKKGAASDQVVRMMKRMQLEADLETRLRAERGDSGFEKSYPHRWLHQMDDIGEYVTDKRALYLNKMRAWEWRMNYEYLKLRKGTDISDEDAAAHIYVINWKDEADVPGMDNDFKFITKLQPSPQVASVLANTDEMSWINCTECKQSCIYPKEHFENMAPCCGVQYGTVQYYANGRLTSRTGDPGHAETNVAFKGTGRSKKALEQVVEGSSIEVEAQLTGTEVEDSMVVECVDGCVCEKDKCRQRVVQRGRQVPLLLFREDSVKGWGMRAGVDMKRGTFVTEYVGQVLTAREEALGSHYTFSMRYGWAENVLKTDRVRNLQNPKECIRKHKPFSIDSTDMGNESRYINHSCEPNLVAVVVYVERHGEFFHRIGLFTRKDVAFGEELTFDYFPMPDDLEAWKAMFEKCRCGTESCKFKERDGAVPPPADDDCLSADSFISDDEVYQRKKKEVRKRRKEKRGEKMDIKKEEEDEEERKRKELEESRRLPDVMRDPMDVLRERCEDDEETLQEMIKERTQSGILKHFINIKWTKEGHEAMLDKARESIERRKREREEQREEENEDEKTEEEEQRKRKK